MSSMIMDIDASEVKGFGRGLWEIDIMGNIPSSLLFRDKYFSSKKDDMCQYHKLRQTVLVPCR